MNKTGKLTLSLEVEDPARFGNVMPSSGVKLVYDKLDL